MFGFEDFGRNIIWRSTHRSAPFIFEFQFCCQAKISRFQLHVLGEKQISQLQISMNDPLRVHVAKSLQNLHRIALGFNFGQALPSFHLIIQGRIWAQFHSYVDILFVFKKVFKLDDPRMVQRPMNSNLTLQFLFGSRLCQSGLRHNLDRQQFVGFQGSQLVHFREASLTQKAPLRIAFHHDLPIGSNGTLLNYLQRLLLLLLAVRYCRSFLPWSNICLTLFQLRGGNCGTGRRTQQILLPSLTRLSLHLTLWIRVIVRYIFGMLIR